LYAAREFFDVERLARAYAGRVLPIYSDLRGKVVVVTGGSKGIGAAACRAFAGNGSRVAVVAVAREGIDRLVEELRAGGAEAIGISADCARLEEVERARAEVEAAFGPADVLVAFAGGFGRRAPFLEVSEAEWRSTLDNNLTATFLTAKAFAPGMIERGRGAIVTMSSNVGRNLDTLSTIAYASSKAGIVMFTQHLAKELGPHGVRVNAVAPATTVTERVLETLTDERRAYVESLSPLGEMGAPEDTAYATLYLASDAARWITGITIDVAGGRVMR
jgi:3-oxoacyl-[acyl-carrier protein] reductase